MKTTMMDPEVVKPYFGMPVIHEDILSDDRLSRDIDLLLDPWLEDYLRLPQTSNLTVDDEAAAVLDMNLFPDLILLDDQPIVEHHDERQVNPTVVAQQVEGYHEIPHHQNLMVTSNSRNTPLDSTKTIKVEDHNPNFIKAPQSCNDDYLQLDELAANWPVACPAGTYETLASINTGVNNNCKSDHMWSDHPNLSTLPSFGHDECIGRSVRIPTVHIWSGATHMMLPEYNPNLQGSRLVDSIRTNVSNYNLKCASTPHDQGASPSTSRPTKRSNAKLSNHAPRMSKVAL